MQAAAASVSTRFRGSFDGEHFGIVESDSMQVEQALRQKVSSFVSCEDRITKTRSLGLDVDVCSHKIRIY